MSNLYNLSAEVAAIKEKLENSELDQQTIADTLEAESFDFEEKCKAVAYVIKEFKAKDEALIEALDEMELRRHAIKNKIYSLNHYLLTCLQRAGVKKVEGVEFDISVRKNPQSVDVFESGLIPESYWKTPEPSPAMLDKRAILKTLKEGVNIPGCRLVQTERVDIK
jgi:hypothetical protein